jgi:hypothetical protein
VHYVDVNSTNATPPFTNWITAATKIQAAVDAAAVGDEVVVTNGVYATGGRSLDGVTTNRVAVDKPITLRGLNGPQSTIILGNGFRCVYLTNGANLFGFTISNGVARQGAGIWCASTNVAISNCVVSGNQSFNDRFGVSSAGGVYGGTLDRCTLSGNSAVIGEGDGGTSGGGAAGSTLNNCTLSANSSISSATLPRSYAWGGGAFDCVLNNCTLVGNLARGAPLTGAGGGSYGGAYGCSLNNCILYYNEGRDGANCDPYSVLNHCCTTPLPTNGIGNIALDPLFLNTNGWANLRLQTTSPCINVGDNVSVVGSTDLDGNPRINRGTVDIGAYEFQSVVHYVDLNSTNPTSPYTNWTTAATNIQAAVDAAIAGDEIVVTNGVYSTGERASDHDGTTNRVTVDKPLSVRSVNGAPFTLIDGGGAVRCVYLTTNATLSGFMLTNGFAAGAGGGLWCESAGTLVSNCIIAGNRAGAEGLGGGTFGGTLVSCILSGNSALGFYGASGAARGAGGGAFNARLNNCTVSSNGSVFGGGVSGGSLNNCILRGNHAAAPSRIGGDTRIGFGGGANNSTLNNCTLIDNYSADDGDGVYHAILYNCIVMNAVSDSVLNSCWVESDPLFVDYAHGDLRLQANSACINAGNNAFAPASPDLDGNPRIKGGTVDLGAYEFQSPTSTISYAWLQQRNLPTDGSADAADPDGDGLNNWQEWRCGTDPTNAASALRLLALVNRGTNVTVTWQSVAGVNYFLERCTSLGPAPAFTPLATGVPGQPGTTTYTDTNAIGSGRWFYRVGVGN